MAYIRCSLYSSSGPTIPDGSTVTPTDDVQTLLNCADIWDKAYTTISQLLADTTSLLAVITDNNAVDYLVRSTTWASDVTGDSTAMTDIGADNYASNTLIADSTWRSAIKSSAYYDNVANDKIPTMSDNTTPSGVASVYATGNSDLHAYTDGTSIDVSSQIALEPYAYRALLPSVTFRYNGIEKGSVSNDTISVTYEFDTTTILEISVDQFYMLKSSLPSISGTFKISVRNHTTQAWTDLFTDVVSGSTARVDHQGKLYDGYFTGADAIKIELSNSTSWGIGFGGLQFKGRKNI